MSGFLSKIQFKSLHSSKLSETKAKLPIRDPEDPRIIYKNSDRASRISVKVKPSEREVSVIVPGIRSLPKAMCFVREQRDWIEVQLEALPPAQPFEDNAPILFEGEIFRLRHVAGRGHPKVDRNLREIRVPAPEGTFHGRVKRLLIREARERLETASRFYAGELSRPIEKISVRDTSSRWGSCITRNGKGHISYSWRLISAPPFVLDYVAAHECAHMIEANHSRAYWAVVAGIFPEYKKAKNWLKKNGAFLHAVGAEF
ncbi:MAG: M48 family metallopeptidase [Hellea sp.]|nr:M48 family metallopeptidase [Hellea sp.]